jgi:hypothetical protein
MQSLTDLELSWPSLFNPGTCIQYRFTGPANPVLPVLLEHILTCPGTQYYLSWNSVLPFQEPVLESIPIVLESRTTRP